MLLLNYENLELIDNQLAERVKKQFPKVGRMRVSSLGLYYLIQEVLSIGLCSYTIIILFIYLFILLSYYMYTVFADVHLFYLFKALSLIRLFCPKFLKS